MKQTLVLFLLIVAASFAASAHAPAEKQPTFLSALKEGQHVSLKKRCWPLRNLHRGGCGGCAGIQGHGDRCRLRRYPGRGWRHREPHPAVVDQGDHPLEGAEKVSVAVECHSFSFGQFFRRNPLAEAGD